MKKKIGIITGVLGVVLIGGFFVARQVLIGYLTPDFVVQQIERQWNCRAEIESIEVGLFGTASVELKGVSLAPRDAVADAETPLGERTRLEFAAISSDSVLLRVRLLNLIRRQLDIQQLSIRNVEIETVVDRDGKASIQRLFEKPVGDESGSDSIAAAAPAPEIPRPAPVEPDGEVIAIPAEKVFNAVDMPIATVAERIEVENGSVSALIEKSGARVRLENAQLALTDIDVDPGQLGTRNKVSFQFEGDLIISPGQGEQEFVRAKLSGGGKLRPFNPETGDIDPVWISDLTLHKGSILETFPVIARLKEKLEKVDTAGIDFSEFELRGEVQADARTQIAHQQGMLTFEKPLVLELPDTTLGVDEKSWIHSGRNEHILRGYVMASKELTKKIEGMVDQYLEKKVKKFASTSLRDTMLRLVKRDGRVSINLISEGDLSKPKVDIVTPLGNLTDVIKTGEGIKDTLEDVGKELLKGLLGQ